MRNRSAARLAFLALAGIVLAAVGVTAFIAMANGGVPGTITPTSAACSPQPCLDLQGYTMWITNVSTINGEVRMQVRFRNASTSTHAAPEDLTLVDSNNNSVPATQTPAGCTHWTRTEFSNGASYGPITICFEPSTFSPPLNLRWTPDMGLFCCQGDVRIR